MPVSPDRDGGRKTAENRRKSNFGRFPVYYTGNAKKPDFWGFLGVFGAPRKSADFGPRGPKMCTFFRYLITLPFGTNVAQNIDLSGKKSRGFSGGAKNRPFFRNFRVFSGILGGQKPLRGTPEFRPFSGAFGAKIHFSGVPRSDFEN